VFAARPAASRSAGHLAAATVPARGVEFYCTNLGARWDRVGRVIARPTSESYIGSSEGMFVKVTWDGQLMVTAGWGPQLSRPAVHRLWPDWRQPNEPLSR